MKHEQNTQYIPEKEKGVPKYESNAIQLTRFNTAVPEALGIKSMRWDITEAHLFPPDILGDTEDAEYPNTPIGRAHLIAERIATEFEKNGFYPKTTIAVLGLPDVFIPAVKRLERARPNKKESAASLMAQAAVLTLRNIQLRQRERPRSSQESHLMHLLLEGLEQDNTTQNPEVTSLDPDFMNKDEETLSNSFHEQIEGELGPKKTDEFHQIRKAVLFAEKHHGDQKRFDGSLNRTHILRLGIRLLEDPTFMADPTPLYIKLTSPLLHDAIEDTDATLSEIERTFGPEVKDAVDALSRANKVTGEKKSDEEYYRILSTKPKYVQEIKGHDRVDNLEALLELDLNSEDRVEMIEKGEKYLEETYTFYYDLVADCPYLLNRLQRAHLRAREFYPQTLSLTKMPKQNTIHIHD